MFPTDTDFETKVSFETEAIPVPDDPPFRILFLGDYSGRENSIHTGSDNANDYKIFEIDRDNFNEVMSNLRVRLRLSLSGTTQYINLRFNEIDDFHPDRIFKQLNIFSELRNIRKRLLNSDTFNSAASEVRSWFEETSKLESSENNLDEESENKQISSGNLLDDILSQKKADASQYEQEAVESIELKSFIKEIVKPYKINIDENEQEKLIALVDKAISDLMRKIIHHPDFQALESAWRGLYFVVRQSETSSYLKLSLFDISKEEISDNLKSVDNLTESDIYKKLVVDTTQSDDSEPWALICGNFSFELKIEDVAALLRLSKIGNILSAPIVSHFKPKISVTDSSSVESDISNWDLINDSAAGKLWATLRTSAEADSLGLLLPRILTRLPYGIETETTEMFDFEEFTGVSTSFSYLWTNPSFAFAVLLAQSFNAYGWEISGRYFNEIEGLFVHIYKENNETKTKSSVEINFNHAVCNELIEQGLMPFISFRNTDSIKLADFQSISFPSKPLKSRWG